MEFYKNTVTNIEKLKFLIKNGKDRERVLANALQKYAQHINNCAISTTNKECKCTCGLQELLNNIKQEYEEENDNEYQPREIMRIQKLKTASKACAEMYSPEAMRKIAQKALDNDKNQETGQNEEIYLPPIKCSIPKGVLCTNCGKLTASINNICNWCGYIQKITNKNIEQDEKLQEMPLPKSLQDPKRLLREFDLRKQVEELNKNNNALLNILVSIYNKLTTFKEENQKLKNQILESNIKPQVTGIGQYKKE